MNVDFPSPKSQTFSPRVNKSMRWHMMAPNSLLGPCFHGQQVTNCQKLARVQHEVGVFSVQPRLNKSGPWHIWLTPGALGVEPFFDDELCACMSKLYEPWVTCTTFPTDSTRSSNNWPCDIWHPNSLLGHRYFGRQVINCQKKGMHILFSSCASNALSLAKVVS